MRGKAARLAFPLILAAWLLAGCSLLQQIKIYQPAAAGMDRVSDELYVDPAMAATRRTEVVRVIAQARGRVARVLGGEVTSPIVLACSTDACFQDLGGGGARGVSFGTDRILLAPRGLTVPILAHELAHRELHRRVGGHQMSRVPRWFDEGLAVLISEEMSHDEAMWQIIQDQRIPHPELSELETGSDWARATRGYGDTREFEEPGRLHVVYVTAGHEVRRWYAKAGKNGLARLIKDLHDYRPFQDAYEAAEKG